MRIHLLISFCEDFAASLSSSATLHTAIAILRLIFLNSLWVTVQITPHKGGAHDTGCDRND